MKLTYKQSAWFIPFVALLVALVLAGTATAKQRLNEIDTLKTMLFELGNLDRLINEAMRRADRQDRYRFEYRVLKRDLGIVKQGLRSAIYGNRVVSPKSIALDGDYGTVGVVGEAALLQQLIQELQALDPLLHDARHQSSDILRWRFNYETLRGDIDTIIKGIQQALAGAGDHPRDVPALRGGLSHD